jgi:3-oxoacyl-[acyl-carrier-protein] synthase II
MSPPRRVVITGMGVVCPLGSTLDSLWNALSAGQSGVRPVTAFDTRNLPISYGGEALSFKGEIGDFGALDGELKKSIRKGLKTICREAQMGIAAAQLAMQDAGLAKGVYDPDRTGAVFGSDYMVTIPEDFVDSCRKCLGPDGRFDFKRWALAGLPALNPLWLLKYLPNMPAAHLSMYNDLRGPNNSLTEREASSGLAVGEAARIIARGHADSMIAGATGTWIHPTKTVHAAMQFELANGACEPAAACRPFDLHRTGSVVGEGAGAVVLEDLDSARKRSARIYAEIAGSGSSQATTRDFVALRDVALRSAMLAALQDAGMKPEEIGHIHAHGLATRTGDVAEASAISQVFGEHAGRVPVTAAKSYFGNLGAGSGLVELVASVLALRSGSLFPVLNFRTPDPECPVRVVASPVEPGDSLLKPNVTLQGQASCVVVRRYRD